MDHRDRCPECVASIQRPQTTEPVPGGVECTYRCDLCDATWTTSWWVA